MKSAIISIHRREKLLVMKFCIPFAINMLNIVKKIASLYAHTKKNTKVFWILIGLIVVSGIIATYISPDIIIIVALQHLEFCLSSSYFIFLSSCTIHVITIFLHFVFTLINGMLFDKNAHTSHTMNSTECIFYISIKHAKIK